MNRKIGIYGGSFDPIHLGHINLALRILEKCHLDEVIFCPANVSPLKVKNPPIASAKDRLEMVKLALEGVPKMSLSTVEIERPPPSFMIDTVRILQEAQPADYFLLLASDQYTNFHLWKEAELLKKLAPPLVGTRIEGEGQVQIPILDISSTEIRDRLSKGLYCGHLLSSKVVDFISAHRLYL